jgi:hypothetical protein
MLTVNLGTCTRRRLNGWNTATAVRHKYSKYATQTAHARTASKLWCLGNEMDAPAIGPRTMPHSIQPRPNAAKMKKDADGSIELSLAALPTIRYPAMEWSDLLEYLGNE